MKLPSMKLPSNKPIEAAGILVMMSTVLGLVTWQWLKGNIEDYVAVTIWATAAPFTIGLYVNSAGPQKAQIVSALWGVFISVVTKKITIAKALAEIEVIISNAVALWDQLNQKAKAETAAMEPAPAKPSA